MAQNWYFPAFCRPLRFLPQLTGFTPAMITLHLLLPRQRQPLHQYAVHNLLYGFGVGLNCKLFSLIILAALTCH
ncbi:hypothetical protein EJ08DRAFT_39271 [Tothia fuscella]|uniref:Uncharacterized protein n=1 Tax=Tothia fuscella TaxID=1048955 RepID=A0A9P4U289_9PEZI|nr:hypothetical protein EJ08DRAFT_39271 [Tothia fuscella]